MELGSRPSCPHLCTPTGEKLIKILAALNASLGSIVLIGFLELLSAAVGSMADISGMAADDDEARNRKMFTVVAAQTFDLLLSAIDLFIFTAKSRASEQELFATAGQTGWCHVLDGVAGTTCGACSQEFPCCSRCPRPAGALCALLRPHARLLFCTATTWALACRPSFLPLQTSTLEALEARPSQVRLLPPLQVRHIFAVRHWAPSLPAPGRRPPCR